MRHFHRTSLRPDEVLQSADKYFAAIDLASSTPGDRTRTFSGTLGNAYLEVRMEGGHYTMVEASTDQMGESRLDKNVKNFFATLHRKAHPRHRIEAGY